MINLYDSFFSRNILRRLINDYTVNSDTENPCIDYLLCCYDTLRFIYLFRLYVFMKILGVGESEKIIISDNS